MKKSDKHHTRAKSGAAETSAKAKTAARGPAVKAARKPAAPRGKAAAKAAPTPELSPTAPPPAPAPAIAAEPPIATVAPAAPAAAEAPAASEEAPRIEAAAPELPPVASSGAAEQALAAESPVAGAPPAAAKTPAAGEEAPRIEAAAPELPRVASSRAAEQAPAAAKTPAAGAEAPQAEAAAPKPLAPAAPAAAAPKAAATEKPAASAETSPPNFEKLAQNFARAIEQGGKVMAAYLKPLETGETKIGPSSEIVDALAAIGRVAEYYLADGQRALQAQTELSRQFLDLWGTTLRRLQGEDLPPVVRPDPGDKRFSAPDWQTNPYFDFLKQAYVLTSRWADDLVRRADTLDPHTRDKAAFYLKQFSAAFSPTNFLLTNPDVVRATLAEGGENLVRGLRMMAEDVERGHGHLRIRQADASKFELGVNLAATPGKVIYRNNLIELIQYAPSTDEVYKRPLLIVPPWINKFYVLDLNAEKSFIRWAVAQGLTVFTISWVNPDERHADKGFEAYMREGVFSALDVIEEITGENNVTAIGYCVGGTLLAVTLAFMAEQGDERIESATLITTQVDFQDPGDLKVFVDAEQLRAIEEKMAAKGYLDGMHMATAFNMLRPNDLIWSYWVNNYLEGKEPMAFDLLVWNADSTRMPAANHRFYLEHCYFQNNLAKGRMPIDGKYIDLHKITIPIYELATREDHIAPASSVFNGAKLLGGPMRYVLSGSGHIAGVVNPPYKPKYQYWTGGPPEGEFSDWFAAAKETPGSWWLDWIPWVVAQAPEKVAARTVGSEKHPPVCDAPGEYVRVRV
ncbi:MAG: PHA/PHB synthase family protein [Roseiarcus sp.]